MRAHDALEILARRRGVVAAVLLAGTVAAGAGAKLAHPQYQAGAAVMIAAQPQQQQADPAAAGAPFLASDMPALLLSDTLLARFIATQHLSGESLKTVRKRIDASIAPTSNVMPIAYKASTPQAAVQGANALADGLRAYYRTLAVRRYDDLDRYLSTALDGEKAKIARADAALQTLVVQDPYFSQNEAARAIGAQLLALDQQRDLVASTMESHAVAAQLAGRRMTAVQPIVTREKLDGDATYTALRDQIAKDRAGATVLHAQFTDEYAGVAALDDQIRRSSAVLEAERRRAAGAAAGSSPTYAQALRDKDQSDAVYQGDKAQLAELDRQIAEAQSHLAQVPRLGVRIATLRRDRDAADTAYRILAEQRTLTLFAQAQAAALGSVTVVDRASRAEPAAGRAGPLLALAAFLAFAVLAFALPFALDALDVRLRADTIQTLYGRPLITTVPAR